MKSKFVAISAISAGFIALCLTVGAYFSVASLVALVLSSIFVFMPLYYNSYKGAFLCYGVGGIIAFLFSGLNYLSIIFPAYFGFFGLFPIIYLYCKTKNLNNIVITIVGIVWCLILFYGGYYFYTLALGGEIVLKYDFITQFINVFLGVVSVCFFFFFSAYLNTFKRVIDGYLQRIIKNDKK